jgi:hypothetical protein
MPLPPLHSFYCDTCGGIIRAPEEGLVEWRYRNSGGQVLAHGFRIVHLEERCRAPLDEQAEIFATELGAFLGTEGLVHLLSLLDPGPAHEPEFAGPGVLDLREWAEFLRRTQVPHYEAARPYWQRAGEDRWFDGRSMVGVYDPDLLRQIASFYEGRDELGEDPRLPMLPWERPLVDEVLALVRAARREQDEKRPPPAKDGGPVTICLADIPPYNPGPAEAALDRHLAALDDERVRYLYRLGILGADGGRWEDVQDLGKHEPGRFLTPKVKVHALNGALARGFAMKTTQRTWPGPPE